MRDLMADKNIIEIKDDVAGVIHEFYYRMPTTKERVQYRAGLFERKGNKIINRVFEQQVKFGAKVVTGFRKGSLAIQGKPISSDQSDPDYREDWKELLMKGCPELLAVVGKTAFEGAEAVHGISGLEVTVGEEEELDAPLEK